MAGKGLRDGAGDVGVRFSVQPSVASWGARVYTLSMHTRLPWPDYFMRIAHLVAERSTCLRRKVGAVAVKDKRILATGYNGTPSGVAHCLDVGCLREQMGIPSGQRHELCRGLHAEQNVIIQGALHALCLAGSDIYCNKDASC